jgi:uncharacterized protein (DUF1810 family)
MDGLARFVTAQGGGLYQQALGELRAGLKQTHWMWFVFPQIAGLGRSENARLYAIADLDEARRYLAHPVLGPRLAECSAAMLEWAGRRTAHAILGSIDSLKFESSMTLFEAASNSTGPFAAVLDAFFGGVRDTATLQRL